MTTTNSSLPTISIDLYAGNFTNSLYEDQIAAIDIDASIAQYCKDVQSRNKNVTLDFDIKPGEGSDKIYTDDEELKEEIRADFEHVFGLGDFWVEKV